MRGASLSINGFVFPYEEACRLHRDPRPNPTTCRRARHLAHPQACKCCHRREHMRPVRVRVEAGIAVEATRFTRTDKQATTYSISRLITNASLVLISHDPAAQGGVRFY